jgi:hypothetical protein
MNKIENSIDGLARKSVQDLIWYPIQVSVNRQISDVIWNLIYIKFNISIRDSINYLIHSSVKNKLEK